MLRLRVGADEITLNFMLKFFRKIPNRYSVKISQIRVLQSNTTSEAFILSQNDLEIIKRHKGAEDLNQPFYEDPQTKFIVWTRAKHLERGKCCGSACRHLTKVMSATTSPRHRVHVLYGSQTGTAQDVAEKIAMQSRGTHFRASAMELDSYPVQNMVSEELIIFVVSTTGQGETPDNMKIFWRFLMRKNLPTNSLVNLKYAVLGLGDSSYAKYNFIAKKLNRRLLQLGGQELVSMGLADDQHEWGADATVDPWVTGLWKKLLDMHPTPHGVLNPLGGALPPPRFLIQEEISTDTAMQPERKIKHMDLYCRDNPFLAAVKSNVRATAKDHFQETILLSLDVSKASGGLSYLPGDVVMIKPSNTDENVKNFLDNFPDFDPNKEFELISKDEDSTLPSSIEPQTTLRHLAKTYFDFMSVPRRSFFQTMHHFADVEMEKEKLVELGTPEGTEERYEYVNRPRRNILEVLEDFHKTTKNIPLSQLLDLIPAIQPRAFSIASSPSYHKDEIHILVAVVKYKTRLHAPRYGLCSNWLSKLPPGSRVPIWVKSGGIQFSNKVSKNVSATQNNHIANPSPDPNFLIMVGPGTGVAPFRSAIHERCLNTVGNNVLFFGCRNEGSDFYFQDEWSDLVKRGLLKLHTAFSRDQDHTIYVQDRIAEQGSNLWELIANRNARIFVAGSSKNMPDGVRDAFLKIFQDFGEMTEKEAKEYYEMMQRNKRYQQETWS